MVKGGERKTKRKERGMKSRNAGGVLKKLGIVIVRMSRHSGIARERGKKMKEKE